MLVTPLRYQGMQKLADGATKPFGFWASASNRRAFMDDIAKALGINAEDPSAWRNVHHKDIAGRGGRGLLKRYRGSLFEALVDIYPSFKGLQILDLRRDMPRNYWAQPSARRAFLDHAAATLGVKSRSDWQTVTTRQLQEIRGSHSLLRWYNSSLLAALKDVYGEEWRASGGPADEIYACRSRVPRNYWDEEEHVKSFVEKIRIACSVQNKEDWYRVSRQQVKDLGGGGLIQKYDLGELLCIAYPRDDWDEDRLRSRLGKRSSQRSLASAARLLLGIEPAIPMPPSFS